MYLLRLNKEIHPVYWINNFLSNEEIDKIIKYTQQINPEIGTVDENIQKEDKKFLLNYDNNVNTIIVPRLRKAIVRWIQLNPDTNWLYKKIISQIYKVNQENFGFVLKFIEDLQFTEYNEDEKSFHSNHSDCGDKTTLTNFVDIRKLSFSIQLSNSSDYEGGELLLYKNNKEIIASKEKGTITFFESDILHKVIPVKKGTRYSLVGWVRGPNLR